MQLQQTGRFEEESKKDPKTAYVTKQGSGMKPVAQGSPEVHVKDFDRICMNNSHSEAGASDLENEMRETSYFK